MSYAIWIPFELPPSREIKTTPSDIEILGYRASIKRVMDYHVLVLREVPSEAAAIDLISKLLWGLRWAALRTGVGLQVVEQVDDVTWSKDPVKAGKNLKLNGQVDGIFRGNMICVYAEDKIVRSIAASDVSITHGLSAKSFTEAISEGMGIIPADGLDGRLKLAIELYCLADFELSPQARFLTLCMALEVAAPHPKEPDPVIEQLEAWRSEARSSEHQSVRDLASRLGNFKRMSHRKAVCAYVEKVLGSDGNASASETSQEARSLYDSRGELVHEGRTDVGRQAPRLKEIVRMTLEAAVRHG